MNNYKWINNISSKGHQEPSRVLGTIMSKDPIFPRILWKWEYIVIYPIFPRHPSWPKAPVCSNPDLFLSGLHMAHIEQHCYTTEDQSHTDLMEPYTSILVNHHLSKVSVYIWFTTGERQ